MRILQLIETGGPGGAETVVAQLSSGLRARGHDVRCAVGDGDWLPGELERRGFSPVLLHSARNRSLDTALLGQIASIIRHERIEVVHAHLFDGAVYAVLASALCRRPCIVTLHGQVDIKRRGVATFAKSMILRYGASAVVTVSNALRSDLLAANSKLGKRLHVVLNGIEAVETSATARHHPIEAPSTQPFRLVAIGNIRPAKDYAVLLQSVAALKARNVAVHVDILGQPDGHGLYESLLEQSRRAQTTDSVTFHGFVADPTSFLTQADAFVLSSSKEGFSLATIEAMLAGVPVVATRSGGPEEIIQDGATGILVPTKDPAALATAVERLVRDRSLGDRLAAAARDTARNRFSTRAMLDAYESLYVQGPGVEVLRSAR